MLTLIDASGAAMADLIDDLLVAVHLESGDLRFTIEPVALSSLVAEVVEAAERVAPDRAIQIAGHDDLVVEVDREQALRALRAVMVNAIHFSPAGAPVEVAVNAGPGAVSLLALDPGPGIPAPHRERALEHFGRREPHAV